MSKEYLAYLDADTSLSLAIENNRPKEEIALAEKVKEDALAAFLLWFREDIEAIYGYHQKEASTQVA